MARQSLEHYAFQRSGTCPRCNVSTRSLRSYFTRHRGWKCYDGRGQPIAGYLPFTDMPAGTHVVCPHCNYKLPVLSGELAPAPAEAEILGIEETHRSEEHIGSDERLVDNTTGLTEMSRKFVVSREWKRECQLEREAASRSGTALTIGEKAMTQLSFQAEDVLKRRYLVSDRTTENYSEEVAISVPPGNAIRIIVAWKKLWQHGLVNVCDTDRQTISFPYRVVAGVTFDLKQVPLPTQ